MSLNFVFEGITVDLARELLTDGHPVVEEIGRRCRYSYLTSLADFAVGLISGARLSTTGTGPGQWIAKTFENKFDPIETKSPLQPKDMLVEGSPHWQEIESYIHLLRDLTAAQYGLWQEHMVREFREFLGEHPSIFEDLPDPEGYRFKKELTHHRLLQDQVPEGYISRICDVAYPPEGAPGHIQKVHPKAVREFITRNVNAHILVFCWYRQVSTDHFLKTNSLRWPHCTRATLIEAGSLQPSSARAIKGTTEPRSLWMMREILMPNILTIVLDKARGEPHPGKIVRYQLQELAAGKHFAQARVLIEEIAVLLASGNDQAARDKMVDFVAAFNDGPPPEPYSIGFPLDYKTEAESSSRGLGHFLRQTRLGWRDYERSARGAFPNLFENSIP